MLECMKIILCDCCEEFYLEENYNSDLFAKDIYHCEECKSEEEAK
jgi:hypothetical protein